MLPETNSETAMVPAAMPPPLHPNTCFNIYNFAGSVFALALDLALISDRDCADARRTASTLFAFARQLDLAAVTGYTHEHLKSFEEEVGIILKYYAERKCVYKVMEEFKPCKGFLEFDIREWQASAKRIVSEPAKPESI